MTTTITLNTGAKLPVIGGCDHVTMIRSGEAYRSCNFTPLASGLGCWSGLTDEEHEAAKPWVLSALKTGYRHLDTAHGYGTEGAVGKAIRESGIPREEISVTTKLP
jgi:diketogulonate reductase-like aldo/keto reductase